MFQHRPYCFSRIARTLVVAGWFSCAHAAELGEPVVKSHIGQNLIADIELTGVQDTAAPVLVRLAHPDIYRGANIAMAPVLSSLQLSVMRRDGRQYLHIVSTRPVNAEHLNLFLDLTDGPRRHVRALTLWLTPDPQPAPIPTPAAPILAPAPAAPVPALAAPPAPKTVAMPLLHKVRTPAPATCPAIDAAQLRTCAALDEKNARLQGRIVELEGKVRALQLAIDGAGVATPLAAAAPSQPQQAAMPKPTRRKSAPFPWLLAGAGVAGLGMLAGLLAFLRRKKAMLKGEPLEPGLLSRLKTRFRRADPEALPVEPAAH